MLGIDIYTSQMLRNTTTKLISGLSAGGTIASITAGSGINVNDGTVSIDGQVVATDTELATQLASKVSASDDNLSFTGTAPNFSKNLTVASTVLVGSNSGFGILCKPQYNSLLGYSLLFDGSHHTLLNKINAGTGEVAIRLHNQNKIAVADLAGEHTNCAIRMTPTSVLDTGMEITGTQVKCNETLEMKAGKHIVVPAESNHNRRDRRQSETRPTCYEHRHEHDTHRHEHNRHHHKQQHHRHEHSQACYFDTIPPDVVIQ